MSQQTSREVAIARRFGYGPANWTPAGPADLVRALSGPDAMAARYPVPGQAAALAAAADYLEFRKFKTGPQAERARRAAKDIRAMRQAMLNASLARIVATPTPLRERLAWFWADHFTVAPRSGWQRALPGAFVDEAIRPHLAGRFADLLKAAELHPAMVIYLDQAVSVGPDSRKGKRSGKGLNENLAREILELHTLGVDGGYSQTDVREFAELLTGITLDRDRGVVFRPELAEPGAETVLGTSYGDETGKAQLGAVLGALDDLALRPETAAHLARKLAVHFIADDPPADLVQSLSRAWLDSGGDLSVVYTRLLEHPLAGSAELSKIRQPLDFMGAALAALAVDPQLLVAIDARFSENLFDKPLLRMGQPFQDAPGPNGWPEAAAHWLTPQGLAERIDWAMSAPSDLLGEPPDIDSFALRALGAGNQSELQAARRAETLAEAVGLVLASPAFNRR